MVNATHMCSNDDNDKIGLGAFDPLQSPLPSGTENIIFVSRFPFMSLLGDIFITSPALT